MGTIMEAAIVILSLSVLGLSICLMVLIFKLIEVYGEPAKILALSDRLKVSREKLQKSINSTQQP